MLDLISFSILCTGGGVAQVTGLSNWLVVKTGNDVLWSFLRFFRRLAYCITLVSTFFYLVFQVSDLLIFYPASWLNHAHKLFHVHACPSPWYTRVHASMIFSWAVRLAGVFLRDASVQLHDSRNLIEMNKSTVIARTLVPISKTTFFFFLSASTVLFSLSAHYYSHSHLAPCWTLLSVTVVSLRDLYTLFIACTQSELSHIHPNHKGLLEFPWLHALRLECPVSPMYPTTYM